MCFLPPSFFTKWVYKKCALRNDTRGKNIFFFWEGKHILICILYFGLGSLIFSFAHKVTYFYIQNVCVKIWQKGRKHILFLRGRKAYILYFGLGSLIHSFPHKVTYFYIIYILLLLCNCISSWWLRVCHKKFMVLLSVDYIFYFSFLYYYKLIICFKLNWLYVLHDHGLFFPLLL